MVMVLLSKVYNRTHEKSTGEWKRGSGLQPAGGFSVSQETALPAD